MAVISFSVKPENIWCVAGWAFRQVLDDVISQYPEDAEMAIELNRARELKGLIIDGLSPDFETLVTSAIKHVVTGILSGAIRSGIVDQPYGHARTVKQYLEGLQELQRAIPLDPTPPKSRTR